MSIYGVVGVIMRCRWPLGCGTGGVVDTAGVADIGDADVVINLLSRFCNNTVTVARRPAVMQQRVHNV